MFDKILEMLGIKEPKDKPEIFIDPRIVKKVIEDHVDYRIPIETLLNDIKKNNQKEWGKRNNQHVR